MTAIRLRYQTLEFGATDIHVCTLRDRQQFSDPLGKAEALGICDASWPLFGVVWPSGLALAHYIDGYNTAAKRILEVGCGIALPSLLLHAKQADITATDYHPEVQTFLQRNALLNQCGQVAFERTNWEDQSDSLGYFDLIIGSDLLYEDQHTELLAHFIHAHAKPLCEIILIDPGRGRKNKLCKVMTALGYRCEESRLAGDSQSNRDYSGHILKFFRDTDSQN